MARSRLASLLVSLALLASWLPAADHVAAQRTVQPLGTGAQFVPSDAPVYLALDLDPSQPQSQYLDRLAAVYLRSPEVDRAFRQSRFAVGSSSLDELRQRLATWVGGEVFFAVPTVADVGAFTQLDEGVTGLDDCREPGLLIGAAIGNTLAFQQFMLDMNSRLASGGVAATVEPTDAGDVIGVGPTAAGPGLYVAVKGGYALASTSRSVLAAALAQNGGRSLAANPAFRDAPSRLVGGPLAFLFSNVPEDVFFGGGGLFEGAPVSWVAGSLQLGPESMRVDVTSDIQSAVLTRATQMLVGKSPNPLQSAAVAPSTTTFYLGWDNVKLLYDQVIEAVFPNPDDYTQFRQQAANSIGLDPELDIFGWMTGELAIFAAPTPEDDPVLHHAGFGLTIEAQDPDLVREKLDKIMFAVEQLESPENAPTTEEIAGIEFARSPLVGDTAIYGALVGDWVLVTTSRGLAEDLVANLAGGGAGLSSDPEYAIARTVLADPLQILGYLAVPSAVTLTEDAVGASGDDSAEIDDALRPLRGVGLAVETTESRIDAKLFVHVVLPAKPAVGGPASTARPTPLYPFMVDASKEGGAWWGPEGEPTGEDAFRYRFSSQHPEHTNGLMELIADRIGLRLSGTLLSTARLGAREEARSQDSVVTPRGDLIVRIGSDGDYTDGEILAYRDYVRCGGALLLLSDGKRPGESDQLAEAFGMRAAGVIAGEAVVDRYVAPASTNTPPLSIEGGTGLVDWDAYTQPIGYLSEGSYLDLNGDGAQGPGEPGGVPAIAVARYGRGAVGFIGTT
ncbi:MAG: hypothetical protein QOF51_484, partial [Chloroflexota bacterium]|nr:hypothetical protein [Chloroflexota bacterium]